MAAWPAVRWTLLVASWLAQAGVAALLSDELAHELRRLASEHDATNLIEARTGFDVKQLDSQVIEQIISRQWWGLARDIVAKSHKQGVDLSVAVRKNVKSLKDEADELLRRLNPKYGLAQQVAPAFQWAQNDTCIFLTVKFTVRWNAPGALEVTDPKVHIHGNKFNFTGLGAHSNNKYLYSLSLGLFDHLSPADSIWKADSVGKLGVTLRKKWARKWPRLLADKKTKIGNMHVWMDTQDRLDTALSGMSTVAHSPVTCAAINKTYCSVTDTCKLNCTSCPGKYDVSEVEHVCVGLPTDKAGLSFEDKDLNEHEFGGTIKITKARSEYDIDHYVVYWGTSPSQRLLLPDESVAPAVGSAVPTGANTELSLKFQTRIPGGNQTHAGNATHLLVFSTNIHGEYSTPGHCILKDAYLPLEKPGGVSFWDIDPDKYELRGTVRIEPAADTRTVQEYAIYWGKSPTKKSGSAAHLSTVPANTAPSHEIVDNTILPSNATTHILVFSKNEHGENPSPVSVKIVDNMRPCQRIGDADCPLAFAVVQPVENPHGNVTIKIGRARNESNLQHYVLYWGRQSCESMGAEAAMNGHIRHLVIENFVGKPTIDYELPSDAVIPDGTTHLLLFTQNDVGESLSCVDQAFARDGAKAGSETVTATVEPAEAAASASATSEATSTEL